MRKSGRVKKRKEKRMDFAFQASGNKRKTAEGRCAIMGERRKGGQKAMERKEKDAVIEARDLVLSARRNMGIIITEASVEDYSWLNVYAIALDQAVEKMNEALRMDGKND